jgi:15-cis-phytoene synthase
MDKSLDDLVRRVDEDRWLASRFAPADRRERLIALYAVYYEIARSAEVSEPGLGAIRLAWWREAIAEAVLGGPTRAHPALQAFVSIGFGVGFYQALQRIVDARGADLERAPFANWDDVDAYLDATAGLLMQYAIALCGPPVFREGQESFVRAAARAWGLTGLLRAQPFWEARGRQLFPPGGDAAQMLERARASYQECRWFAKNLHSGAFPAFGYVATLPVYFRALAQSKRETSQLGRKAIMIGASATGRV